jgi:hypothetical protein
MSPASTKTLGPLFWPPYIACGVLALAGLGLAHEPKDSYYPGWLGGWMDNPFTWRDDLDRTHLRAGFLAAIPAMILGLWADLFSSRNLLRSRDPDDLALAATVLRRLDEDGTGKSEWLLAHGTKRPARVLHALSRLRLIMRVQDGIARRRSEAI